MAQRLQPYAIIKYKSTNDRGNADGLSRLSAETTCEFDQFETTENEEILCDVEDTMRSLLITQDHVCKETLTESALKSVSMYLG